MTRAPDRTRGDRAWAAAVAAGALGLLAALLITAPADAAAPVAHPLQAIGGALCLLGVVVAATGVPSVGAPTRRPFISEVLALCWRRGGDGTGWWRSVGANLLLAGGALLFLVGAVDLGGLERVAATGTALCLLGVVALPLRAVDPSDAPLPAFAHPTAAAAFYLAAMVLSLLERASGGPVTRWLAAIHVATSSALVALAIVASVREYGWRRAVWPLLGTRILLDTRPHSRARWVSRWQWGATFLAGAALAAGALGW